MILRLLIPFSNEGVVINEKLRTSVLDTAIADLVTSYKYCRKWNYECSVQRKDPPAGGPKHEIVSASVLEVHGKNRQAFDAAALKAKTLLNIPLYVETADNRTGVTI